MASSLKLLAVKGSGRLQFSNPHGIACSANRKRFYVADTDNHHVQVLNFDLGFIRMFGTYRDGRGQFDSPMT